MMAERLGGEINPLRLHPDATNQSETGPMAIFQYMIGGTDWSIPNQHNVKMLQGASTRPIAIPYDLTGLVYCARIYLRAISPYGVFGFTKCTRVRFQTTVSVPDFLKITYTDSAQKYEPVEKYGFLIEDET